MATHRSSTGNDSREQHAATSYVQASDFWKDPFKRPSSLLGVVTVSVTTHLKGPQVELARLRLAYK